MKEKNRVGFLPLGSRRRQEDVDAQGVAIYHTVDRGGGRGGGRLGGKGRRVKEPDESPDGRSHAHCHFSPSVCPLARRRIASSSRRSLVSSRLAESIHAKYRRRCSGDSASK